MLENATQLLIRNFIHKAHQNIQENKQNMLRNASLNKAEEMLGG